MSHSNIREVINRDITILKEFMKDLERQESTSTNTHTASTTKTLITFLSERLLNLQQTLKDLDRNNQTSLQMVAEKVEVSNEELERGLEVEREERINREDQLLDKIRDLQHTNESLESQISEIKSELGSLSHRVQFG